MALSPPISRRLLLGRLGSGTGIIGTFLLPGAALAAAATLPPFGSGRTRRVRAHARHRRW